MVTWQRLRNKQPGTSLDQHCDACAFSMHASVFWLGSPLPQFLFKKEFTSTMGNGKEDAR